MLRSGHTVYGAPAPSKGTAEGGAVIVANQPLTRNALEKLKEVGGGRVLHVLWRGEEDDLALIKALAGLGLTPPSGNVASESV